MSSNLKFFNRAQLDAMAVNAKEEYIIASRGLGKSEGFDARFLLRNVTSMPRSSGAILSPTYSKLLKNTLPAIAHALERWGFKRNLHYFLGRKAPITSNFGKPYIEPFSWEHSIHWWNGSVTHLLSFDRAMSANSMSLDYLLGPEAKYLDYKKIKEEVNPANRGNRQYFGDCPWHHSVMYTTDMPTSKGGMWIFEKEKQMDNELINTIRALVREKIAYTSRPITTAYVKRKIADIQKDLDLFRKNAVFYKEYDIFENIEVVGEEFVAQMKRDLPRLIFLTAICNVRLLRKANGFYASLSESHFYTMNNNAFLEACDYDFRKIAEGTCLADADCDLSQPLCIAMDYNSSINNLVVGQQFEREMRTLSSFFVKTPEKVREVVTKFCNYYIHHKTKEVVYYYDHTAVATSASSDESLCDIVSATLESHGWKVQPLYIGQAMSHNQKHMLIDLSLKGDTNYLFPTFNSDNNEYLKLAMEQAGIKVGRNGFEKDKGLEKEEDTPDNPDELKTHITDAWDTLWAGMNFHPFGGFGSMNTTTWLGK